MSRESDVLGAPTPVPAAEVRKQKERNQSAIRLVNTWLNEDAAVESDTSEKDALGYSEADITRLRDQRVV